PVSQSQPLDEDLDTPVSQKIRKHLVRGVKAVLPTFAYDMLKEARDVAVLTKQTYQSRRRRKRPCESSNRIDLSGVVYTTILNPVDGRKNWEDIVSGFLYALGQCDDATLVFKIVTSPQAAAENLDGVMAYYERLKISHRCTLIFITEFLSDEQ